MIFAYKKYALPLVTDLMNQKEQENLFLIAQKASLEKEQINLDELMFKDSLFYEAIKIKINEWNKKTTEQKLHQKQTNEARITAFKMKKNRQRELFVETLVKKQVAQKVVLDLHNTLTEHFEKNNNRADYLDSIITTIQERKL
jgi:hypothetical protein